MQEVVCCQAAISPQGFMFGWDQPAALDSQLGHCSGDNWALSGLQPSPACRKPQLCPGAEVTFPNFATWMSNTDSSYVLNVLSRSRVNNKTLLKNLSLQQAQGNLSCTEGC